jgi:hypothetical protein
LKGKSGGNLGSPAALAIDGDQVWVSDASTKKIYRYSLASLFSGTGNLNAAQEMAVPSGNNKPGDLALDATYVYSLDESTKQLYRVPKAGGSATLSKVLKETGGGSLGNPSGVVLSGGDVYVSDFGKDKFYKYSLSSLFAGSGNQNASAQWSAASGNGDARGL